MPLLVLVVLLVVGASDVSGSPISSSDDGAALGQLTPGTLRELAGLRDPAATTAVLEMLGLLTLDDITMLNAEEQGELRFALVTGGVPLSERAKFRRALLGTGGELLLSQTSQRSQRMLQEGDPPGGAKGGSSGGLSSDTIAVLVTALLAVAGYLVQNKQAQAANATQNKIAQEMVKHESVRARANEQLKLVMKQQQLFAAPFAYATIAFYDAMMASIRELNLVGMITQWSLEWLSIAGRTDLEILRLNNPTIIHAGLQAPYLKILQEDIEMLEAEAGKKQLYMELVVHTWQPPLRALSEIFAVQMHMREQVPTEIFDERMPNTFGMSWSATLGSLGNVYGHVQTYVRQLESVVARWERDDFTMLQPVAPCPCWALVVAHVQVSKLVGRKQTELLGVSSGSSHLALWSQSLQSPFASREDMT
jgi:hypothetical protein